MKKPQSSLKVPGKLESLEEIANYIDNVGTWLGMSTKDIYKLKLAIDELATNVITHGYIESDLTGDILLSYKKDKGNLVITMIDKGRSFKLVTKKEINIDEPLDKRDIGGLGVYLAHKLVKNIEHKEAGKSNYTIFTVTLSNLDHCPVIKEKEKLPLINNHQSAKLTILLLTKRSSKFKRLINNINKLNFKVHISSSTDNANFKEEEISLVLVDERLIHFTQYKILDRVRANSILYHTPIVLLLENENTHLLEVCFEKKVVDYLQLNLNLVQLKYKLAILTEYVKNKKQNSESIKYLRMLVEIVSLISKVNNVDELLYKVLINSKEICNADGGTLYIREKDFLKFSIIISDTLKINSFYDDEFVLGKNLLPLFKDDNSLNLSNVATYVANKKQSVNIPDIYSDQYFDFTGAKEFDIKYGYHMKSNLTIPLLNQNNEVIGVLQLINARDKITGEVVPFDFYFQNLIEAMSSLSAIILNLNILSQYQKEFLRYENEMHIATNIQQSFLPNHIPSYEGWIIDTYFSPAREVGGDFYDIFPISETKARIVIADITDKGVSAALFMALFRTLIRTFSIKANQYIPDLLTCINQTNQYILNNHIEANMFATLFIAEIDFVTGQVDYINAGHPFPMIVDRFKPPVYLKSTGPALGMFMESIYTQKTVTLEEGQCLLTFTDGLLDATNSQQEFFGEKNLLPLLSVYNHKDDYPYRHLLQLIIKSIENFSAEAQQFDDLTIVTIGKRLTTCEQG